MPTSTWSNLDERRRERVLRAAMAEFGRHGYSGGSLNVVAREAGVAKGSLFQYFADKLDFFAHVAEQTSLTVYAAMTPHLDDWRDDEPFTDWLARVVIAWMDWMGAHPLERGVTAATTMELDPQVRVAVREPVHRLYVQGLRPLLDRAATAGEIQDADAALAQLVLLLPHLALAPFEPGLDAALPLHGRSRPARNAAATRLVRASFAPIGAGR